MLTATVGTPARTLMEDPAGSGSPGGCPAICSTDVVMGVADPSGGFGLCRCDNTTAWCQCGDCYQRSGGMVLANSKVNGECAYSSTNCEGCAQWEYIIPTSTTTRVNRRQNTTTTSAPQAATSTPIPSTSVVASPVAVATEKNSGGTNVFAILVIIVAVVVMGIVAGMTIVYYKKMNAPRRRRRKPVQTLEDDATTPEQEYVVVVYPVHGH